MCGPKVTLYDFAWFGAKAQSNARVCLTAPSDTSKYYVAGSRDTRFSISRQKMNKQR